MHTLVNPPGLGINFFETKRDNETRNIPKIIERGMERIVQE
jgi:hypothetical protein